MDQWMTPSNHNLPVIAIRRSHCHPARDGRADDSLGKLYEFHFQHKDFLVVGFYKENWSKHSYATSNFIDTHEPLAEKLKKPW